MEQKSQLPQSDIILAVQQGTEMVIMDYNQGGKLGNNDDLDLHGKIQFGFLNLYYKFLVKSREFYSFS